MAQPQGVATTPVGHPWHPALVHLPLAAWLLATLVDLGTLVLDLPAVPGLEWPSLAHLLLWAGVLFALPAMAAGLRDYLRLPEALQDSPQIHWHMMLMASAWLVYLVVAVWRWRSGGFSDPAPVALVLVELAAMTLLLIGGWLAGDLVYRLLPAADGVTRPGPVV